MGCGERIFGGLAVKEAGDSYLRGISNVTNGEAVNDACLPERSIDSAAEGAQHP